MVKRRRYLYSTTFGNLSNSALKPSWL